MSAQTVTIDSLGAQGDGIVHGEDGPLFVGFALPGETVAIARVKNQGTIMSITVPSPDRVEPPCRHFGPDGKGGTCGGCTLQHLAGPAYRDYKRSLVVAALKSKNIDVPVGDLVEAHPGERRRVVFAARRTEKDLLIGFNQAESHHIVAIEECPIASPGILASLEALRRIGLAAALGSEPFRIGVLETLSGLDVAIDGLKSVGDKQRRAITDTMVGLRGVARVSLNGEIVLEPRRPLVDFGGVSVSPPPGAFAQATIPAEEAMARLTIEHIGKAKRIADLFAGTGTFSLRLARIGQVHAVESEDKAVKALDQAARNTQGLKAVTVEKRDLFRRPLMAQELKVYDAVVFDPPRAGAEAQCRELIRSTVKKIVAISCNPLTLARDLSILIEGGYRITSVTPIDQFLWTSHVEVVATLVKG
ncbi:class I SAM-dependent RNA methyltransferase [Agrobacterium sp. a22-2]|uniref:class I SAM-dependent RNA methyltransferase n=1 Tax=Agrobacterium sp. a22-2 TaxID=2283840 RepID=UPI0014465D2A|nr:class I SAM-dependent RNA methyltransferase [Agrobacterium sp. a22-2]NKN39639.1 class I SAM-dependent RNA methyltransferase [Agrobacterium sp. a22-2]